MARVHFSSIQQRFTGGTARVEVGARTVQELVRQLEELFPGLGAHLDATSMTAVAIDGEIIADAAYEQIGSESDIHFVAPLVGG